MKNNFSKVMFLFLCPQLFGQTSGQVLTPGTVVIGQCQGHTGEPGCVLPNLFGSTGLTLFNNPAFSHFAHFIGSSQSVLNQTVSTAIATQLVTLPLISPASGFTYKYDQATGAFVRTATSLGPVYTERAETIGRGKFSFGTSYQRFRFGNLDGIDLHKVPAVFSHVPGTGPGGADETYEADVISTVNNIDLKMDQTVLFGTVGITDRIDVSVAVPIVDVRMSASSSATIMRISGPTFIPAPGAPPIGNPHEFNAGGALTNTYTSSGSASGIGDVTFRVKGNVYSNENLAVAFGVDVRTPTGSAREYLGSGSTGVKPFVAISGRHRFSPHMNLGFGWNGQSILAGNITGTTVGEDAADNTIVQNGPATKHNLPRQLTYALGADTGVTRRLTVSFDYLGQTLFDAPRAFLSDTVTQNIPGGTGSLVLPTISGGIDTIGLNSGAVGLKYNLFGKLLLIGDVLFKLDNKGLRQTVTPLVALSYEFGH
ncbi:MAG TPA: transporter [Bryobacteraceae bacterium]|nr:transporter [Bryobacteraceae bacterium]